MVDVEIIDAKNGQGSILVSADPEMCNCGSAGAGGMGAALAPAGHTVRRPSLKLVLLHMFTLPEAIYSCILCNPTRKHDGVGYPTKQAAAALH